MDNGLTAFAHTRTHTHILTPLLEYDWAQIFRNGVSIMVKHVCLKESCTPQIKLSLSLSLFPVHFVGIGFGFCQNYWRIVRCNCLFVQNVVRMFPLTRALLSSSIHSITNYQPLSFSRSSCHLPHQTFYLHQQRYRPVYSQFHFIFEISTYSCGVWLVSMVAINVICESGRFEAKLALVPSLSKWMLGSAQIVHHKCTQETTRHIHTPEEQ